MRISQLNPSLHTTKLGVYNHTEVQPKCFVYFSSEGVRLELGDGNEFGTRGANRGGTAATRFAPSPPASKIYKPVERNSGRAS